MPRYASTLMPLLAPSRSRAVTLVVAAVVALIVVSVLWPSGEQQPDAQRVARIRTLASVQPPRPSPEAMRGAADDRTYARGLEAYASGRWDGAIASLSRVDRDDARFYCAVAELMQGNGEAAELLLRAVEDGRAEFYAREAAFYRVKAALARQDLPAARGLITEAVRIGAGPPGQAAQLRDELEVLR
jgi:hypothetical protein